MSTKWSRPALQRQELGPMLHDLGHTVYDLAETTVLPNSRLTPPVDYEELSVFAGRCAALALAAIEMTQEQPVHQMIEDLLDDTDNIPRPGDSEYTDILTYGGSLYAVLKEGIDTGIVAPLQLYKAVNDSENIMIRGQVKPGNLNAEDIAVCIESPVFQAMLHQLAIGHNGSLGAAANDSRKLSPSNPESFRSFYVYGGSLRVFEYDSEGRVIGFKDDFLVFQKQAKQKERQQDGAYGLSRSGGCPVRHTTFPVGPRAQAYFEALGRSGAQPQKPGESLITRASKFVCVALRASVEAAEL